MHAQSLSCVQLFATPGPVAHQAPLSIGFPRQKYWSGLPFLTQGSNPHLLCLLHWQVSSLPLCHLGSPTSDIPACKNEEYALPCTEASSFNPSSSSCFNIEMFQLEMRPDSKHQLQTWSENLSQFYVLHMAFMYMLVKLCFSL